MSKLKKKTHLLTSVMALLPLFFISMACEQSSLPTASEDSVLNQNRITDLPVNVGKAIVSGNVAAQLTEVKRLTAHYHDQEKGADAGWFDKMSECVEVPGLGGMGYHFGNPEYLGNGILDPLMPEVLLYEPQKNGRLRLVGVEYIVPEDIVGSEGPAPMLFGEHFHWNPALDLWALHVWIWRNNPAGMFADFNPKVNCDYAPEVE